LQICYVYLVWYIFLVKLLIFLQDIVQVKVNNVVYIINVSSKDAKSKQVNHVTNPIATTIWNKLSV
jgi:fibronectin type 3 domain-containing protein